MGAEWIFGQDEFDCYKHPYVGYEPGLENNDEEVKMDLASPEICYICKNTKEKHSNNERRQELDDENQKLIDLLLQDSLEIEPEGAINTEPNEGPILRRNTSL